MLNVYTLHDVEKWNTVIGSFKEADIYYFLRYVEGFKLHGDGDPLLFYFNNGSLKAANVVMKRDIANDANFVTLLPKGEYFDLATPYGYGGFIYKGELSDHNLQQLNNEYVEYCHRANIISEFVRFHPVTRNAALSKNLYDITQLGKTVTLTLNSKQQIWTDYKSNCRRNIRKALGSGVEIYWSNDTNLLIQFIPMYLATMARDHATPYYSFEDDYYYSLVKNLKYNIQFFYAVLGNNIISMSLILAANKKLSYHLSASDPRFQEYRANNLLLSEVAFWGVENGFESFHLGGGLGSKEDNLYRFKSSFSHSSNTYFSIGKKIFDQEKYDDLIKMRGFTNQNEMDDTFFPAYRKT